MISWASRPRIRAAQDAYWPVRARWIEPGMWATANAWPVACPQQSRLRLAESAPEKAKVPRETAIGRETSHLAGSVRLLLKNTQAATEDCRSAGAQIRRNSVRAARNSCGAPFRLWTK